jgi:tetratricopeptide (TPR) repeat protein
MFPTQICLSLVLAGCLMGQTPDEWRNSLHRAEDAIVKGNFLQASQELDAACRSAGHAVQAALCRHDRGLLEQVQARYPEAELSYKAAVEFWEKAESIDRRLLATTLHNLGDTYREMGRWQDARLALSTALKLRRGLYGDDHALTISTLGQLAMIDLAEGDFERAGNTLQSALSSHERLLPASDPKRLTSVHNLAQLRIAQGQYPEALQLLQGLMRVLDETSAPSLSRATAYANMASLYRRLGNTARALPLLRKAQGLYENMLGREHLAAAMVGIELGMLFAADGKYRLAEIEIGKATELMVRVLGRTHREVALAENSMALVYLQQGKIERSADLLERLIERTRAAEPASPRELGTYLDNLAEVYRLQGRLQQAEDCSREAFTMLEKALGSRHPGTVAALERYGQVLRAGRKAEYKEVVSRVKALRAEAR